MLPVLLTDTVTPDLERSVHYTLMWGLEGVELRSVGGVGDRVPFVNEAKLRRRLDEAELPVAAVVPGLFEGSSADRAVWLNQVTTLGETLRFCGRIGCRRVVVSAFVDEDEAPAVEALRRAGEAAARHGVTVAVLNESERARATGGALAALLAEVDHPAVRAAWNPAAALRSGEDPAAGLAALRGRVALVRCADGSGRADRWTPQPFGEGGVGWPAQLDELARQGYDGPLSLEVHVDPRPKQGLHDATRLVRLLRDVARGAR